MEQINQDYDSPWKDILETYFRQFLAFFFPLIEKDLNWEKGMEQGAWSREHGAGSMERDGW